MDTRHHHEFGPSSLSTLASCPAFLSLPTLGGAAAVGTALHGCIEAMIGRARTLRRHPLSVAVDFVRQTEPMIETEDQAHLLYAVAVLVRIVESEQPHAELDDQELALSPDRIYQWLAGRGTEELHRLPYHEHLWGPVQLELRLTMDLPVPPSGETIWGYADALIPCSWKGAEELYWRLVDFKFGSIEVSIETVQLTAYAVGVFQRFPQAQIVRGYVVQPKYYRATTRTFFRNQLPQLTQDLADIIVRAQTVRKNPELFLRYAVPGRYCRWCNRLASCPVGATYLQTTNKQPAEQLELRLS